MIVLSSSNLDEGLRGYNAKYDTSSGDLNPIGNIVKKDIRDFLRWFAK
jgi:NH3-dependent NAD+ synthetase